MRNRAKELATLLSDVDLIRAERRKARANKAKYQGGGNTDFVPGSGGGRYGGFGSDSYYAGGAPSMPSAGSSVYGASAEPEYDEYDAGDDEHATHSTPAATSSAKPAQPAVADLFSFDDESSAPAPTPAPAPAAAPSIASGGLDDFDDFQAAPAATAPAPKPAPAPAKPAAPPAAKGNLFDFFDDDAPAAQPAAQPAAAIKAPSAPAAPAAGPRTASSTVVPTPAQKPSTAATFDDLWATSRGKPAQADDKGKKSMAQLAKDQTSSSVWGANTGAKPAGGQSKDLFDLL